MYIQLQNFGKESSLKSIHYEGKYECAERIHQFPEIVLVLEGSVEITVDGVCETANAGDIAVITPFRIHSFKTPDYCKIWIGVFSTDFTHDFLSGEYAYHSGVSAVFTPTRSLFDYAKEHLPPKYDEPIILDTNQATYGSLKAFVYVVFDEYSRFVPKERVDLRSNAISLVLLYMSKNYRKDISLISMSKELGYSPTYISHCISVIPNMNFRKLINSLRIDHAKLALAGEDVRMIDVAIESGFSCERTFNRAFVEIVGIPPSKYRKSLKIKKEKGK